MSRYVFDIEANGLYNEATKIHCIRMFNVDTQVMYRFDQDNEPIFRGIRMLNEATELIGHNIIGYDLPTLHKLHPKFTKWKDVKLFDTIIISKLACATIDRTDMARVKEGKLPSNLIGSHGLKAWGYRLGEFKGEYGERHKGETDDEYKQRVWTNYSKEMADYCEQDVITNYKLYLHLLKEIEWRQTPQKAIDIEHKFATIISRQERHGVTFDIQKAEQLERTLRTEAEEALEILRNTYKPKWFIKKAPNGVSIEVDGVEYHDIKEAKVNRRKKIECPITGKVINSTNSLKGSLSIDVSLETFNPNSSNHVIRWLTEDFGWIPTEFTDKGAPKTDADTLSILTFEGIELLQRYQMLLKRLSQLSDGKGALLNKFDRATGKIYGRCDTLGAVTRRCTHCVPMSTKALTKQGWKEYHELVIGEEILGFDMNKGVKTWTKIVALNKFKDAKVGSIGNKSQKLRSTAEHKWLVSNRSTAGKYVKQGDFTRFNLVSASDINTHSAILVNAPYVNPNLDSNFILRLNKYNYNHLEDILSFSKGQLDAYLLGFLLADGHLKKSSKAKNVSWSFSQVKGQIQEATQTALYLSSEKRISAGYKNKGKKDTHKDAYNITQTMNSFITSNTQHFQQWEHETTEDVWCPTTELGTWVMKQDDDFITITGNSSPNMAQIPSNTAEYGSNFRELCTVPEGYKLVGADASGLELRTLAHYLSLFDGGEYAKVVLDGDIHWKNCMDAGFIEQGTKRDKHNPEHDRVRAYAKTFIYAFLYGAGTMKLGEIVCPNGSREQKEQAGNRIKKQFMKSNPAISQLVTAIKKVAKETKYVVDLDGNSLYIRSEHSAPNLVLQSCGAIVMKYWAVVVDEALQDAGYENSDDVLHTGRTYDYENVLNIHDEAQLEVKAEIAEDVAEIMQESFNITGLQLEMNIPIDGEAQIGTNWSETH